MPSASQTANQSLKLQALSLCEILSRPFSHRNWNHDFHIYFLQSQKIVLSCLPWIKFVFLDFIELRALGLESLGTHAEVSLPLSKVCVLLSNQHMRNSSKEEVYIGAPI